MKQNDAFAQIAAAGISTEGKGLITPEPPVLEEIYFRAEGINKDALFTPLEKLHDKKSLYEEVERQKEHYRPFFADYAPKLEEMRTRQYLTTFQWRVGTDADLKNFVGLFNGEGNWETVSVPHFGEPLGVATTYYRTTFTVETPKAEESLWITFRGVDYKAHVFLNGAYLGSHEGMFAPFEFEITAQAAAGENVLVVAVENDFIHMGDGSPQTGRVHTGDKFYGATGPGYDDPVIGWHHCPPGMGIYQDVYVEKRSRLFISDIFVRPVGTEEAEVWLEVVGCDVGFFDVKADISIYGQNFEETVVEHQKYSPSTGLAVGVGDSFSESRFRASGELGGGVPLKMERGINYLKIPVSMKGARIWDLDTPWLYQVQVRLYNDSEVCLDTAKRQFGMRAFRLDETSEPKGMFYLNDRKIRLRGANTMGFEQQCVMKKDWEQLYTDLVLAKVCNMNFIRLTQRPVQEEVYDYCDRLGLMLQTDLPAFGSLRRNQFAEGIRQVQEMEHLIRSHASAVLVTYINEPMPNAKNMPHRCMLRHEMEDFFTCSDLAIRILNPDRVVKHIDGDYDPPTAGLPDNHCYPAWYNGHGIDMGRLHKGFWMNVKPGWNYGCGEYGVEGLDPYEVMEKYYPKDWMPQDAEDEYNWTPGRLIASQSGNFHHFFYDTQHTVKDWIRESQKYQAQAVRMMTEAYRRDRRMVTFAYHLFIDAFPEGWTKTLMDVDRNPKEAFFAYRNALEPVMLNLRTDRFRFFAGEEAQVECWVCNDRDEDLKDLQIKYQILNDGEVVYAGIGDAYVDASDSRFQGYLTFKTPETDGQDALSCRKTYQVQAALVNSEGKMLDSTEIAVEVFPKKKEADVRVCVPGAGSRAVSLLKSLGCTQITLEEVAEHDVILIDDYEAYKANEAEIMNRVESGANLVVLDLIPGIYDFGGHQVNVKISSMLPFHFASRNTGHPLVEEMEPEDIKFWYDETVGYITPLMESTFTSEDFEEVVTSANQDDEGCWQKALAVGVCGHGKGRIACCQLKLADRTEANPVARELACRLIKH